MDDAACVGSADRAMGDAGLVRGARRGRERIWELEPKRLEKARRCLDQIADDWDAAINRLKAFVAAADSK